MLESDRNAVFAAQTENVRALEQAWKHINKAINAAYSSGDTSSSEIHTKLLAQVYCAFAEAVFSKEPLAKVALREGFFAAGGKGGGGGRPFLA